MTLCCLDEPARAALRRHDKEALLASLQWRVAGKQNPDIEIGAYEICADVIGPAATDWIRERWTERRPETFYSLAKAAEACLPLEEGFGRVAKVFDDEG